MYVISIITESVVLPSLTITTHERNSSLGPCDRLNTLPPPLLRRPPPQWTDLTVQTADTLLIVFDNTLYSVGGVTLCRVGTALPLTHPRNQRFVRIDRALRSLRGRRRMYDAIRVSFFTLV